MRVAVADAVADDLAGAIALISEQIAAAARHDATLLLTSECALVGYPPHSQDRCAIAEAEDLLHTRAQTRGIALGLGTTSAWRQGTSNDLLWCGAVADSVRYRKRFLTPMEANWFVAGDEALVVEHAGWRLGLAICFDLRFPLHWLDLAAAGADAFCAPAVMAGPDPDPGCKDTVVPMHCASRAAELATPLLLCNARRDDAWLGSGAWDARGLAQKSVAREDALGLQVFTLARRESFDPWYAGIRRQALADRQTRLDRGHGA